MSRYRREAEVRPLQNSVHPGSRPGRSRARSSSPRSRHRRTIPQPAARGIAGIHPGGTARRRWNGPPIFRRRPFDRFARSTAFPHRGPRCAPPLHDRERVAVAERDRRARCRRRPRRRPRRLRPQSAPRPRRARASRVRRFRAHRALRPARGDRIVPRHCLRWTPLDVSSG